MEGETLVDSAGPAETVHTATTPAVGGSYSGVDPMGPVDFLNATLVPFAQDTVWPFGGLGTWNVIGNTTEPMYWWAKCSLSQAERCTWSTPRSFTFTATSGTAHASVTIQRGPAAPVTARLETVAATGFYGVFWQPPAGRNNHIGVVEWSGALNNPVGAMLAAHGYPTLDLAWYGEPGLPQSGQGLRLEYAAKALHWIGTQPGVNPKRLWAMGYSSGSETALLLGVDYPNLVHGVAALSPDVVAACNAFGAGSPTWTLGGQPVPCTNQSQYPPTDTPAAAIPVANIHGPVLIDCGEHDSWSSCASFVPAVMAQLAAAHDSYAHQLLEYPDAGHGLGSLLPYYPGLAAFGLLLTPTSGFKGTSMVGNSLALADQWPKVLAFLRN